MKLILVQNKPSFQLKNDLNSRLSASFPEHSYDGESTQQIKQNLSTEDENAAIVTADSRFLKFVFDVFDINDVYICRDDQLKAIKDTTARQLRMGHDLMKMYESREFFNHHQVSAN